MLNKAKTLSNYKLINRDGKTGKVSQYGGSG